MKCMKIYMKKVIDGCNLIQNLRKQHQLQQYKNRWWKQGCRRQKVINGEYVHKQRKVIHWLSRFTKVAAIEHLKRRKNVLMILCVTLDYQDQWYKEMVQRKLEQCMLQIVVDVSSAGTLNITYVKQYQQGNRI